MQHNYVAVVAVAGLLGCAADDPTLGESSDDVTIPASNFARNGAVTLGATNKMTCFLDGIAGSFPRNPDTKGWYPSEVQTDRNAAESWEVAAAAKAPALAQATAICVAGGSAAHEFGYNAAGYPSSYLGTANTHCFLRDFTSQGGLDGSVVGGVTTNITIAKHPQTGGAVLFDFVGSRVNGATKAIATCFDYANTGGWGYLFYGPAGGAATYDLRDYYPSGPLVPSADVACGLTGIGGSWVSPVPDPLGYADGMTIVATTATPSTWQIVTANSRSANVECLR